GVSSVPSWTSPRKARRAVIVPIAPPRAGRGGREAPAPGDRARRPRDSRSTRCRAASPATPRVVFAPPPGPQPAPPAGATALLPAPGVAAAQKSAESLDSDVHRALPSGVPSERKLLWEREIKQGHVGDTTERLELVFHPNRPGIVTK